MAKNVDANLSSIRLSHETSAPSTLFCAPPISKSYLRHCIYIGDIIETNDILDNIGKIDTMETSVIENPKLVTCQQYVYQMKAEIILNSNLTSDHMIC